MVVVLVIKISLHKTLLIHSLLAHSFTSDQFQTRIPLFLLCRPPVDNFHVLTLAAEPPQFL